MPIKLGKKTFAHFKDAEAYVKRTMPNVGSPGGYVASIAEEEGVDVHKKKRRKKKAEQ